MPRTLYSRLSLTLALLLVTVGVIYSVLSLSSAQKYLQITGQTLNLELAKNLVMDRKLVQSGKLDTAALSATFMEFMVINPSIELYLLDLNGKILSYSADPGKVKRQHVSLQPIKAFLNGETLPLLGDDPRDFSRQKIFSVTPIPSQEQPEGYLYVVLLGEKYDNIASLIKNNLIWRQSTWALIISLAIALLIGVFIFRRLTQRLNTLSRSIASFQNIDDRNSPLADVTYRDEIDFLNQRFIQMADRITRQLDAIKTQDQLRRDLVANVSHDLRTPIAVIHGYLETLRLKVKDIDEKQRVKYINSALKSSEQLQQLINELFELAYLDSLDTAPEKEPLNLNELVHDIAQQLSLSAEKKSLKLDYHFHDTQHILNADIHLLGRLFENLLTNAIKFSPTAGNITISFKSDHGIICTICNSGNVIAPEELPFIFDRYFQSNAKGQQSTPGGLGLTIAKRIVELHNGKITVSSNETHGTCFTVILPH